MKRMFAVLLMLMLVLSPLVMFAPEAEGARSDAFDPAAIQYSYATGGSVYISGNNVLTYDRIVLLAYNLRGEIGSGHALDKFNLSFMVTGGTANGTGSPLDVFAVAPFTFTGGMESRTFDDTFINANCPEDGHVFQLYQHGSYLQGEGMSSVWQNQYANIGNGYIYIGLAGWNFNTASISYALDQYGIELAAIYDSPPTWAPTITSSAPTDPVCFMDYFEYEPSANESVTWDVTVTPPTNGTNWLTLDEEDGTLFGYPFPYCGAEGLGEYEVSLKATSVDGALSAWQNFTVNVTSTRNGANIYESFGVLNTVSQPGLFGGGAFYTNSTLTWDVGAGPLHTINASQLSSWGWDLYTVLYTSNETLAHELVRNDTARTIGLYGRDALEELNGTASISYLYVKLDVGNSTVYAVKADINVSAEYFGITSVSVDGVPRGLSFELPGTKNVTMLVTTTLDWLEEEGYDVRIYSFTASSSDYLSWAGGNAGDSTYQVLLSDAYGDYWLNWTMEIKLDGVRLATTGTGSVLLTIREPYSPAITSLTMEPAYVGEGYDFTFAAVETDLFILQYPVPSWATWDNATGTFTGTPEVGDLGVYMIVVYPYNTTDGITGDPFYAQFIVRPAAEAGDGIGFFGYVFSSIIALLFCMFLSISKDGFNATVFMALVPMAIAVLISVGAMPLWTIIVGILFYGILIFRNVGPGDSL